MISFQVNSKDLETPVSLLVYAATLKSYGAIPVESVSITFTQTTMALCNMNESNGVLVRDIPITVLADTGNLEYTTKTYAVNAKKLDSAVKSLADVIDCTLTDSVLTLKSKSKRFELPLYTMGNRKLLTFEFEDQERDIESFIDQAECLSWVTSAMKSMPEYSAVYFNDTQMLGTDRLSTLFIKDSKTFSGSTFLMNPDLFVACHKKIKSKTVLLGRTPDDRKVVMVFGNIALLKTKQCPDKFPAKALLDIIYEMYRLQTESSPRVIETVVDRSVFEKQFKDLKAVTAEDTYELQLDFTAGRIILTGGGLGKGASGDATIPITVTKNETVMQCIKVNANAVHIQVLLKMMKIYPQAKLVFVQNSRVTTKIAYITLISDDICYTFVPQNSR